MLHRLLTPFILLFFQKAGCLASSKNLSAAFLLAQVCAEASIPSYKLPVPRLSVLLVILLKSLA